MHGQPGARVGNKHKKKDKHKHRPAAGESPAEYVKRLMKAGKVKKKCCRSKPQCKRCPIPFLLKERDKARKKAAKKAAKAAKKALKAA